MPPVYANNVTDTIARLLGDDAATDTKLYIHNPGRWPILGDPLDYIYITLQSTIDPDNPTIEIVKATAGPTNDALGSYFTIERAAQDSTISEFPANDIAEIRMNVGLLSELLTDAGGAIFVDTLPVNPEDAKLNRIYLRRSDRSLWIRHDEEYEISPAVLAMDAGFTTEAFTAADDANYVGSFATHTLLQEAIITAGATPGLWGIARNSPQFWYRGQNNIESVLSQANVNAIIDSAFLLLIRNADNQLLNNDVTFDTEADAVAEYERRGLALPAGVTRIFSDGSRGDNSLRKITAYNAEVVGVDAVIGTRYSWEPIGFAGIGLGPEENEFADVAARDAYTADVNNAEWVNVYNNYRRFMVAINGVDFYRRNVAGDDWEVVQGVLRGRRGLAGAPGSHGMDGAAGFRGWSPVLTIVADGDRLVLQLTLWLNGQGPVPIVNRYVGLNALVDDIADAVDIRGPRGLQGVPGSGGGTGTGDLNAYEAGQVVAANTQLTISNFSPLLDLANIPDNAIFIFTVPSFVWLPNQAGNVSVVISGSNYDLRHGREVVIGRELRAGQRIIAMRTDNATLSIISEFLSENLITFLKLVTVGGATFTGETSGIAPVQDANFATKKYVDDAIGALHPAALTHTRYSAIGATAAAARANLLVAGANRRDSTTSVIMLANSNDAQFIAFATPADQDDVLSIRQTGNPFEARAQFNPAVGADDVIVAIGGVDHKIYITQAAYPAALLGGSWTLG